MVGVPKSNACLLCLNRRKKCDSKKPQCTPCRERGVLCPGYRQRFQFVSVQQGPKEKVARTIVPATASAAVPASAPGEFLWPTASDGLGPAGGVPVDESLFQPDDSLFQPLPLPVSMQSTVFQQQLVARFQSIYIPSRRNDTVWGELDSKILELPSWIWLVPTVQQASSDYLLNDIVLALVLGKLGTWECNDAHLRLGSMLHARAVRRLRARIKSKSESQLDSTLAAVMVFGVYEVQIGSGGNRNEGYWAHLCGVNALLALRGPSIFESAYGRKLFWGTQFNQFVVAVRKRGSYCVTLPNYGVSEKMVVTMPTDVRLYPIIQRLPPLMARVDQFRRIVEMLVTSYGSIQASQIAECLYRDFVALRRDLEAWEQELLRESVLHWEEPSVLYTLYSECLDISPDMAMRLCFPSPRIAHALTLSWATSLIISATKRPLFAYVDAKNEVDDHATALLLVRSMEYFLHPDMGLFGSNVIGMAMEIAREYFQLRGSPKEKTWFDVLDVRTVCIGSGLGAFLKDLRSVGHKTL